MLMHPKFMSFAVSLHHIACCCFQLGAGQKMNENMNEDQREGLMDGVEFLLSNPNASPRDCHENWLKMKENQGWIYGPEKNFDLKTHPDLIPFDELPMTEKRKDVMTILVHRSCVDMFRYLVGLSEYRKNKS